jgi:hypothetical protein
MEFISSKWTVQVFPLYYAKPINTKHFYLTHLSSMSMYSYSIRDSADSNSNPKQLCGGSHSACKDATDDKTETRLV